MVQGSLQSVLNELVKAEYAGTDEDDENDADYGDESDDETKLGESLTSLLSCETGDDSHKTSFCRCGLFTGRSPNSRADVGYG